jgi:hypothetical protein
MPAINSKLVEAIVESLIGGGEARAAKAVSSKVQRLRDSPKQAPPASGGPDVKVMDSLTPDESVGLAEPRRNPFQQTLKDINTPEAELELPALSRVIPSEKDLGTQAVGEAVSKQRLSQAERAKKQRVSEGSLEGEETVQEVEAIQKLLDEDKFLKTLSPNLQRDITENILIPEHLGKKEIDTLAKTVFEEIKALEKTLAKSLPERSGQGDRGQLRKAQDFVHQFKIDAAQAAERGRISGDPTEMQSLLDRLTLGVP